MRLKRQPPSSLADEHPELSAGVSNAVEFLRGGLRFQTDGESEWLQHAEFAERAEELGDHLDSALVLADRARYADALTLVRTALEQQMIDRLLLLAEQYVEQVTLDDGRFATLKAEFDAGIESWTHDVVNFESTKKGARLVRRGYDVRNDDGFVVEHLSPYYLVLDQHHATLGPVAAQQYLNTGMLPHQEQLESWARENAALYRAYLQWLAIRDNLVLNGMMSKTESRQLDVHYRFLCAFTHATATGYRAIRDLCGAPGQRVHNHYLGELVLLYSGVIAVGELRTFVQFAAKRPSLRLSSAEKIDELVEHVSLLTAHLWFPGGSPTTYDRFSEANRRAAADGPPLRPVEDPATIPADEILYYPDPLDRLVKMHNATREMTTGLPYQPPW